MSFQERLDAHPARTPRRESLAAELEAARGCRELTLPVEGGDEDVAMTVEQISFPQLGDGSYAVRVTVPFPAMDEAAADEDVPLTAEHAAELGLTEEGDLEGFGLPGGSDGGDGDFGAELADLAPPPDDRTE